MTDRTACRLYLLVLIVAPLAFGTMETWSRAFMETGLFLAALLFFINGLRHPQPSLYRSPGLLALLLFLGFLLLQITPLPPVLLQIIAPAAYALRGPAVGLSGPEGWLTISMAPKETLVEFFRFAAYAAVYFLTIQFLNSRERINTTIRILIILAALVAIEALFQRLTAGGLIYWFRAPPSATPIGPYVYRNHYAGFMEMLFPLALCMFLYTKPYSGVPTSLRERIIVFFNDHRISAHALYGISAAFIATTIFISLSRGGIISLSLALLILSLLLRSRGQLRSNRYWFILVPSVTLVFVSWFGWEMIVERFLKIQHTDKFIYDGRFEIWRDTLAMIREFILPGSGFGSFEKVFPFFQEKAAWQVVIDHAHNDYLELLATGGLLSFLLLTCFLAAVVHKSWPIWRRRRNRYVVLLGGGTMAAMVSLLLHTFVDFNFSNGANALYFFMLCGLLVAISHSRNKSEGSPSLLEKQRADRAVALAGSTGAALLLATSLYFNLGVIKGEYRYREVRDLKLDSSTPPEELHELQILINKMIVWDPLEAKYRYSAGNVALFLNDREGAAHHYRRARRLDPTDSWNLLQLGQLLAADHDPQGLKAMAAAVDFAPFDLAVLNRYSHLLLWLGEKNKALAISGRLLALTGGGKEAMAYFTLLSEYSIPAGDIHQATPKDPALLMTLGNFLARTKQPATAGPVYEEAMALAEDAPEPRPWYFTGPGWFFMGQKDLPRALKALDLGLKIFPDEPGLHSAQGEALRRSNDLAAAEASYRRAVELAADNPGFRLQLAAILTTLNRAEEADREYEKARELLETSSQPQPWHFNSLKDYYQRKGRPDDALQVMEKGAAVFPENANILIQLGDIQQRLGNPFRAKKSFRKALDVDPGNRRALDSLKRMANQ